jgi:predicted permease
MNLTTRIAELLRRARYWVASEAESSGGMDEEMRLHLEYRARKLMRDEGMTEKDAMQEARRRFGNALHLREKSRDMWGLGRIDDWTRDLLIAIRALARRPGFTATAVLTLAIGIGANTAVFSVVHSVLLKPLAYPEPDRLVAVVTKAPGAQGLTFASGDLPLSASMWATFADQNQTLEAVGVWTPGNVNITQFEEPEQIRVAFVGEGVLAALRVQPLAGRLFEAGEYVPSSTPTPVILSHRYWQRRFGSDPSAVGRTLRIDSRNRDVIGVMPAGFRMVNAEADLLIPLRLDRSKLQLPGFGLEAIGRLKPGVDITAANTDLARLIPVWMRSWPAAAGVDPKVYESWRITPALRPLNQAVIGTAGDILWPVMATIAVVMLIAAANVASLMLVRMDGQQQEIATRSALGATPQRIARELMVESTVLALAGGALGLLAADAGVSLLVATGPAMLPRLHETAVDGTAAWFTLGFSVFAGLLTGLLPAMRLLRGDGGIGSAMRSSGRTASGSRDRGRTRNTLVVAQVGLAAVLLISAGLMIRTVYSLRQVEPGFTNAEQIQTVRIAVPGGMEQVIRAEHDIVNNLSAIPGVESVAFISEIPMDGRKRGWDAVCAEGKQELHAGTIPPTRTFKMVSPGFFRTMGTRLIAGRDLTWSDVFDRRPSVLLSENLAREMFGGSQAALGQRIGSCVPGSPMQEVIGVVQDMRDDGLHKASPAIVYWRPLVDDMYGPGDVNFMRNLTLVMRTASSGEGFLKDISRAVWSVNKSVPLASSQSMQAVVEQSMAPASFALVMLSIAGAMALLLGVIGLYGVIAYSVSQRRREMGIRLALGARPGELKADFVRQSLMLTGGGVVLGLLASAGLMRLMQAALYGTSPLDPLTYAVVPAILLCAAVAASYLPARRVSSVDPVEALRADG